MADTKIDRKQHESTSRHKAAIQRYINGLHNTNREAKLEEIRAKQAIADLEKDVAKSGKSFSTTSASKSSGKIVGNIKDSKNSLNLKKEIDSGKSTERVVPLFTKKEREKKIDHDLSTWSPSTIDHSNNHKELSGIEVLKDDARVSSNDIEKPKKSLFKKRGKVSKS